MRIAMLAPRQSIQGPVPKLTALLAEGLRRLGCEVEVLPWGRRLEGERLPAKLAGRARDVLHARRVVRAGRYPLVYVNTAHDWSTLVRDLALVLTLPRTSVVVLQFHGSQSPRLVRPGSRAFKSVTRALLRRADAVFVLSNEEREEWQAFSPGVHVVVVRYPRPELPGTGLADLRVHSGPKTILSVGRLIPGKGQQDLVRALPLVQETVPSRLVLAGDGPDRERLEALAAELGVGDSVELTGYVEGAKLGSLYRSADVFALPTTLAEGFPTVILEAMGAGLPIVTTRARGPRDHLVEGEHVLFVPPHDPKALAERLLLALTDGELNRRLGDANREKIREFDPDRVAADYLAALHAIAAGTSQAK
jgi:glycosyltransferase involved in cell wall biosynthesis